MNLYDDLKKVISKRTKNKIKRKLELLRAAFHGNDLTRLAKIFNTDKFGSHFYTPHYQNHFSSFKNKKLNLLEIGVGGYANPESGGNSLRMWKSFFKKGKIYSIDIYDKSKIQEPRIKIFQGSQIDMAFLEKITSEIGKLDIVVDDGSHINQHVIQSFEFLFPKLTENGIYVIEDVQTSYWPEYGGSSDILNNTETIMGYFKSLTDGLNHSEFILENYNPTYYDLNITSIHFYHNMIFINKGTNNEKSNYIVNNQKP